MRRFFDYTRTGRFLCMTTADPSVVVVVTLIALVCSAVPCLVIAADGSYLKVQSMLSFALFIVIAIVGSWLSRAAVRSVVTSGSYRSGPTPPWETLLNDNWNSYTALRRLRKLSRADMRGRVRQAEEIARLVGMEALTIYRLVEPFKESSNRSVRERCDARLAACRERTRYVDGIVRSAEEYVLRAQLLPVADPHLAVYENEFVHLIAAMDELSGAA